MAADFHDVFAEPLYAHLCSAQLFNKKMHFSTTETLILPKSTQGMYHGHNIRFVQLLPLQRSKNVWNNKSPSRCIILVLSGYCSWYTYIGAAEDIICIPGCMTFCVNVAIYSSQSVLHGFERWEKVGYGFDRLECGVTVDEGQAKTVCISILCCCYRGENEKEEEVFSPAVTECTVFVKLCAFFMASTCANKQSTSSSCREM